MSDSPAPGDAATAAVERELVARLQRGDEEAFEALVRSHTPRMLAVARRITRDEDAAQDAVQDAFIQAFRRIDGFEGRSQIGTWLHRITVNAALQRIRTDKRRAEEPLDDLQPEFDESGMRVHEPIGRLPPVDALLEQEELRARVRRAIDELPGAWRTILILRDIEGLDTETTARMLDITPNNAKVRLHRARVALRKVLEPVLGDLAQ